MNSIEPVKQPELAKHDATLLDLAFIIDCTGSMGPYIENARDSIRTIVEEIVTSEKSDIRMALVEYRDHVPEENTFVTRKHDFTSSVGEMKHWLEEADAIGGGDIPEAVADALYDGLNLNWRNDSTKICVLISDAPPHGLSNSGDSFGEGCPAGHDPIEIVREMAKNNITLYSVGCEPAITPYKDFFMTIAYITGGQYIPLRNANLLSKVIIGSAQEQISLDRLMQDVENEVLNETQSRGGDVDVIEMSRIVQEKLEARGVMSKQLLMNDEKLEGPSENTIKYSKMSNMKELKDNFKIIQQEYTYYGYEKAPDMMIKPACLDESLLEVRTCAYERPIYVESKKLDYISAPSFNVEEEDQGLKGDNYTVQTDVINIEQTSRMVQKALSKITKKN